MSRLLVIGDSNIYRNVPVDRLTRRLNCPVTILEAARSQTFDLRLSEINQNFDVIVLSSLTNLLCDIGDPASHSGPDFESSLKNVVTEYVVGVQNHVRANQKVFFVPSLFRSNPPWYGDYHSFVNRELEAQVLLHPGFRLWPGFRVDSSCLLRDGVHLNVEGGSRFFDYIASCFLDVLPVNVAPRASTSSAVADDATSGDVMRYLQSVVVPRLDDIAKVDARVDGLEKKFNCYVRDLDIIVCRHAEDHDNSKNEKKANRVVVSGFPAEGYPTDLGEQKDFLVSKLRAFVEGILGEVVFDVYPPRGGRDGDGALPNFDLRFTTVKDCQKFKSEAFKKVRDAFGESSELRFFPKLVLGTRVRIEILRALSKKISDPDLSAYCPIHASVPLLHLGPVENGKVKRTETLTFVDAVLRFRHLINVTDLDFAYKRLGNAFVNALPQNFLVLNESDRANFFRRSSSQPSRGVKRKGEEFSRGGGRGRGKKSR